MTQQVPTSTQERTIALEDLFEHKLFFIQDTEAQAIIRAIYAYCDGIEMLEQTVAETQESQPLFKILQKAHIPEWLIGGVVSNDFLREYTC